MDRRGNTAQPPCGCDTCTLIYELEEKNLNAQMGSTQTPRIVTREELNELLEMQQVHRFKITRKYIIVEDKIQDKSKTS